MIVAITRELPTSAEIEEAQASAIQVLAHNVYARRKARGLTQVELANAVGRTQSWVHQVEKGRIRDVPFSLVVAIAVALGVRVNSLTSQREAA